MNTDNLDFYDGLHVGNLSSYAKTVGIENSSELDFLIVKALIDESSSIVDLGCGEGRVIDGLIERNYWGKILGVERCRQYFDFLKEKYRKNSNVDILNLDILNDDLPKADLAFLLWNTFMEFSLDEQKSLILKMRGFRNLVIDCQNLNFVSRYSQKVSDNERRIVINGNEVIQRIPSFFEMNLWAKESGKNMFFFEYKTKKDFERVMYIFN